MGRGAIATGLPPIRARQCFHPLTNLLTSEAKFVEYLQVEPELRSIRTDGRFARRYQL
jgi:hypothetical protein